MGWGPKDGERGAHNTTELVDGAYGSGTAACMFLSLRARFTLPTPRMSTPNLRKDGEPLTDAPLPPLLPLALALPFRLELPILFLFRRKPPPAKRATRRTRTPRVLVPIALLIPCRISRRIPRHAPSPVRVPTGVVPRIVVVPPVREGPARAWRLEGGIAETARVGGGDDAREGGAVFGAEAGDFREEEAGADGRGGLGGSGGRRGGG